MRTPTLDILIPHYQDPSGLKESLKSINEQRWSGRLRVIVADDGSNEIEYHEARRLCDSFGLASNNKIELLRRTQNKGRPYTRNELLDCSEATHLAWLDAGDTWSPNKLETQFNYLSAMYGGDRDLSRTWITCDYGWVENGIEIKKITQNVSGDQIKTLMSGNGLRAYLWTLVGTRESFIKTGYFDERLARLQDLDYFIRFVRGGGRILKPRTDEPLAKYFKNDVGRDARQVYGSYRIILDKNQPALRKYPRKFRLEMEHKAAKLAARFAKNNNDKLGALKYELISAKTRPVVTIRQLGRKIIRRIVS
ncbi:glycosyltransferase family 2 protein [Paracoccus marcusii]|uniref:glycosyltransferase family 2 protein n=1 Tax=Paracoccus marcusii TaxID=59779 RepID=UPI00249343DA|nr:glycosyltransferase family 2 protein [Paracoccus marcusii]